MESPATLDPTQRLAPEAFAERAAAIEREVGNVIVGQRELVRQTLTGLLANSHVLLEGVPGLGKTMLVRTIADVIDCSFNRIQFTPDLMPADITGTNILVEEDGKRIFRFQSGQIINFGDVRMVGFDINDLKDMYKARLDADRNVFFLPEDVIDNTIRAFATDPTSPTGYSALGPPEGRYFAPASGPDCLETVAEGYGSCGERDIFMDSPWIKNMDISVVKAVPLFGRVRAEFRVEMLNAFNWINYSPSTGVGSSTRDGFETNSLTGLTQSRIIQLVSRVSW